MNIQFPFWMNKGSSQSLAAAIRLWWIWLQSIVNWPVQQFDIETAELFIVDLVAWERDVERFTNEPEWLYRLRVKHAYANARDAGSAAGLQRIWERMGLGFLTIEERIEGRDWDVVNLVIAEAVIAEHPELLDIIIEKYGRTCRQYEWTVITNTQLNVRVAEFGNATDFSIAKL